MAIRAADAGNYPWQKNAAGTYAANGGWDAPREESREVVFY